MEVRTYMITHRKRLMAVSGTALALVIATTAAVAAHGPRDDDRGMGGGKGRMGAMFQRGGDFGPGMMGLRGGLRGDLSDVVRRDVTVETVDGISTQRLEGGTVTGATDTSLDYTLSNGEAASVTTDEDTKIVAFTEQTVEFGRRGISRQRLVPEEVTLADIAADSEVIVWSLSEDGETFVAQRIVVQPADEADEAEEVDEVETETEVEAADEATTGAVTDA
jgi:hypothetical protein